MSGRPLRFFAATALGWVALRTVMLWPAAGPAAIPRALVPAAFADDAPKTRAQPLPQARAFASFRTVTRPTRSTSAYDAPRAATLLANNAAPRTPAAPSSAADTISRSGRPPQTLLAPPPATAWSDRASASRWSASAWFVLRDGRGIAPGVGGGQLGASQTGLRVAYAIGDARRVAIAARVASPVRGKGREAAIGFEWRPTRLPVRLVAEYRAALDGGGSGPAAGIIAGTGPAPLALGFDLETYGQAGVIRRRRAEPFAEGAARLSRPVVKLGGTKVDVGLGGWGGAQRGAQRLDIGPSLGVRVPVAGKSLRLSLDWRQRVAGNARPGSGPVLVIGSDF